MERNYDVIIQSYGGGLNGQSEAIKLGIARALYKLVNETDQRKLKTRGFLTRNATKKERRSLNCYLLKQKFILSRLKLTIKRLNICKNISKK